MDLKAVQSISYGLYILSAKRENEDNACVINTVCQVTSSPVRITIAVRKENYTHDMVLESGKFTVSVLSADVEFETFRHFGFQSGRNVDKIAGMPMQRGKNGILFLEGPVNARLECEVIQTYDLGTHTLFLANVVDAEQISQKSSVTYADYHSHIKPKPQQAKKGWRCSICGYVYEGDPLPSDFICPICKHGAVDFVKI